jgi:hypothetical protein
LKPRLEEDLGISRERKAKEVRAPERELEQEGKMAGKVSSSLSPEQMELHHETRHLH